MVCTVDRGDAAPARWLINSQTCARFKLPEKDKGEISRFSKDGSRFFTLSSIEEPGTDSVHRLLSFYRIKNSGVELVNSLRWEEDRVEPAWLGNDQLLYHKRVNLSHGPLPHRKRVELGLLSDRGELWTVDIQTGQQRPFFAATDSVADH
jgi:hypothetical protein